MTCPAEKSHVRLAEEKQVAIYRAMTPQQRLAQGLRMNHAMRELLATGFRSRNPGWTEQKIARAVADRLLHAATG